MKQNDSARSSGLPLLKSSQSDSITTSDSVPTKTSDSGDESVNGTQKTLFQKRGQSISSHQTQEQSTTTSSSPSIVILPWSTSYKSWWVATILGAIVTVVWVPYHIAFDDSITMPFSIVDYLLFGMFATDIWVKCHLVVRRFNNNDGGGNRIATDHSDIMQGYATSGMLWVDLFGVVPFYPVAAAMTMAARTMVTPAGEDYSSLQLYLPLLQLTSLVRLHRMVPLSDMLQYNSRISLIWFTLTRNFAVLLTANHLSACVMYFLARSRDFAPGTTWLGSAVQSMNGFERYVVSLYQSVVTFSTVGYGDFAPANAAEQIWGMVFMLINVVLQSWVFGSITLLILKSDEKTGDYRDALQTLDEYTTSMSASTMQGEDQIFDESLKASLKKQLWLEYHSANLSDEQVLKNFPSSVRRKILRKLYLPQLLQTNLLQGVPTHFVDVFLTSCSVEIFSPGEEIVERGSIASELFFLLGGSAQIVLNSSSGDDILLNDNGSDNQQGWMEAIEMVGGADTGAGNGQPGEKHQQLHEGEFIGEIGFFTESPQVATVVCTTVCKTLTLSREIYRELCVDYP